MTAVLDAGALIAVDRRDRAVLAMLRVLHDAGVPLRTSAAVVAQVWRDGARQANLARLLAGVDIRPIDESIARPLGALLARSGGADVVDAHVASLAQPGDVVLTSDTRDIRRLLRSTEVRATVLAV